MAEPMSLKLARIVSLGIIGTLGFNSYKLRKEHAQLEVAIGKIDEKVSYVMNHHKLLAEWLGNHKVICEDLKEVDQWIYKTEEESIKEKEARKMKENEKKEDGKK
ncbi:OLC1v1032426C1 [Oldenlandia corymbosa var. corymbosa]|uniref:OLC1v1032426C1 n=1 Tax=Oldenlandia corymbosa var. corymbosa TaxID=529605 RepID=A0AAV1CLQ2_OLDCO|nr:OLC1v1032426C1 [Oldenlandia corymbosa var. corymbosa]